MVKGTGDAPGVTEFRVLGGVEVRRNGQRIELPGARARELLVLFLTRPNTVLSTDRIIDELWGESSGDRLKTLWVQISRLRTALEPDRERRSDGSIIRTHPQGYILDTPPESIDARRFENLADAGQRVASDNPDTAAALLSDALDLWNGPPFAGFEFADFAQNEITRLNDVRLTAVALRIDIDLALGKADALAAELDGLVREHPFNERLAAQRMLALYRSGRTTDALRAYRDLRVGLADEVGLEPSEPLRRLEAQILDGDDSLIVTPSATPAAPLRTDNLRPERNVLVDRPEVDEVTQLLEPRRVVNLVGPGGIGKSRCATAAGSAALRSGDWDDGVWFVDLAPQAADRVDIAAAVADVIGDGHQSSRADVESLTTYLSGRRVLIILDNCEHVRDAALTFVDELLEQCSSVAVLATSRVRFGIARERSVVLSPMTLDESKRLFRARAAEGGVESFPDEDVENLCSELDCYPLAIELAAARTRALSPREILDRLARHPGLVVRQSSDDQPGRHASLDVALDWSLTQVEGGALDTLHRAAVFTDDFELSTAEAVLADERHSATDVIDHLGVLVEHHLLARDHSHRRFRLLQPIRQTLLARRPISDQVGQAHCDHFISELADIGAGVLSRDEAPWWDRFERKRSHAVDAVRWAADRGDVRSLERAMRSMPMLVLNAIAIGPSEWADDALGRLRQPPTDAPYTALTAATGWITSDRHDECDRVIDELSQSPDPRVRAVTLYLASYRDSSRTAELIEPMLSSAREADDDDLVVLAHVRGGLAGVTSRADQHGNPTLRSSARFMSYVTMTTDERALSAALVDECYTAAIESKNPLAITQATVLRANVMVRRGAPERAAPFLLEVLEMFMRQRSPMNLCALIEAIASILAFLRREPETSAKLWAAVDATGFAPLNRVHRYAEYPAWVARQLSPDELDAAQQAGRGLGLEPAAREARKSVERMAAVETVTR